MKRNAKLALLVLLVASVSACTTLVPTSGASSASTLLKADVTKMIGMFVRAADNCNRIDSIQTEVLKVHPVGSGKTPASQKYGSVEERWTAAACGKNIPFLLTFTPDGKGGAFFSTTREKPAGPNP